jgi:cytochrome b subunit of formate dehydrogenase
MDFLEWGTDPWGQETLVRASWDVLYLFFWAAIAFIVFHLIYAAVWVPRLSRAGAGGAAQASPESIPSKITRHTAAARAFHWIMAASMLALMITGFLPIIGVEFSWLTIHWVAGLLLTVSVLYHVIHATFFLDFWSIWIGPADIKEVVQRVKRQMGADVTVQKHPKYPLDHRLYHLAVTVAGFVVIATGLVMMVRIDTPLWTRDAYLLADQSWGVIYALHGVSASLFVMLTLTHIYFAIRPDKLWLTKSMLFGYVDREQYLDHHDPSRWAVSRESGQG